MYFDVADRYHRDTNNMFTNFNALKIMKYFSVYFIM